MTLDVAINKTHGKLDVKVTIQVLKKNKQVNDNLITWRYLSMIICNINSF